MTKPRSANDQSSQVSDLSATAVDLSRTISPGGFPRSPVLARRTNAHDLVFGEMVNSRNIPMDHVDKVARFCAGVVPVRVTLEPGCKVKEFLNKCSTNTFTLLNIVQLILKKLLSNPGHGREEQRLTALSNICTGCL